MSLPDLCIAPYEAGELAPDEPLCAPATYRVWVWSLFWGGYYLVRSVKTDTGYRVFIARHQGHKNASLLLIACDEQECISTEIRKGNFAQYLYFNEEGRLAVSIDDGPVRLLMMPLRWPHWRASQGDGFFNWRGAKPGNFLGARWQVITSALQIEREIGKLLADSSSDCAFAWRWAHMSTREHVCLLLDTNEKILVECEDVLRSALWTEPDWKSNSTCQWFIDFTPRNDTPRSIVEMKGGALNSCMIDNDDLFRLSPRQLRLLKLVVDVYELRRNIELNHKTATEHFTGTYWRIFPLTPTQHERLEARLRLRDWLSDKVAPEEIPFLLGENA